MVHVPWQGAGRAARRRARPNQCCGGSMEGEGGLNSGIRMLRAMRVIEAVGDASIPVSISQLAQRVEIPKATLARLVANLVASGYLSFIPGQRVLVPGPRSVRAALRTLGNGYFRRECRTVLREVVNKLGETCNLVAMDGDCVLYIERVETGAPLRMHLEPGAFTRGTVTGRKFGFHPCNGSDFSRHRTG